MTLFLRRKDDNPEPHLHYRYRVDSLFGDDEARKQAKTNLFSDAELLTAYCAHVGIPEDDYKTLLAGVPSDALLQTGMFREYRRAFDESSEVKALQKQKSFQQKSADEQKAELDKRFIDYVRAIEREKLYYFILAYTQPCPVLVVRSPQGTEEMKKFLGYEWSAAKGQEGIKYLHGSIERIQTPLFDPQDRNNAEKISTLIRRNFMGEPVSVSPALQPYAALARLVDLLDFSRVTFDKQISLVPKKTTMQMKSRWQSKRLGDFGNVIAGQSPESQFYNETGQGLPFYQGKKDFGIIYLKEPRVWTTKVTKTAKKGDILISVRAPVGDVNINPYDEICIGRGLASIRISNPVSSHFVFQFIRQYSEFFKGRQLTTFDSISTEELADIQIPVPPFDVQEQIVAECQAIDDEAARAEENIRRLTQETLKVLQGVSTFVRLDEVVSLVDERIDPAEQQGQAFYVGLENIESGTGELTGNLIADYSSIKSIKTAFKAGDILYGKLRPNLNKVYLAQQNGICSTDILVLRPANADLGMYLSHYLLTDEFNQKVLATVSGQQLPRTSWEKMRNLQVRVPQGNDLTSIVDKIKRLQTEIQSACTIIASAPARRQEVLQKYL